MSKTSLFTRASQSDINTQKYCLKNGWMERKMMEERKERREKFSLNIFNGDIIFFNWNFERPKFTWNL